MHSIFDFIEILFLEMKVEPSSPIRNSNPFSRSSSGSSLHTGNHSSSSGHGMYYRKILYANINLTQT